RPVLPSPWGNRRSMLSHWRSVRSLGYRFHALVFMLRKITWTTTPAEGYFLDGQLPERAVAATTIAPATSRPSNPPPTVMPAHTKMACHTVAPGLCSTISLPRPEYQAQANPIPNHPASSAPNSVPQVRICPVQGNVGAD